MNTIVEKDSLTFKDIEKEIFKYVCQIAVDLTKEFLAEYDKKLMQQSTVTKATKMTMYVVSMGMYPMNV